ncbi:PREDICTED: coiled-coil-helix-coiled-coil-helix domain-containing protein 7 [Dufourea novaeangliae]|nr:PREDICTED: coiled-coil-helix-coiled-coil-helix domain-containing protein 7 [Dufourea novaeangliae]
MVKKLRHDQELNNPCLKEHGQALKCLDNNNYDKKKCEVYFVNYRICKTFWAKVMNDRKKRGIDPILPLPEEREKLKAAYFKSKK